MSFLNQLLLTSIAVGKVQTIIAKKKNRLILKMPNETDFEVNFDIVKSWGYEHSVKITENPVEQGVNINDHRIIQPSKLTIEVGVSNIPNPLNVFSSFSNVLKASALLFTAGFKVGQTPTEITYVGLKAGMDNSDVFDVDSPVGLLENYLIVGIKHKNESNNYGAFEGTIELQEILTFENLRLNTKLSGVGQPLTTEGKLQAV